MNQIVPYKEYFNRDQIELIKGTICKGATDLELKWFLYQAARAKLDPFARQIYWIKRKDGSAFTLVSIDGLRLVAQRSGDYAGQVGPEWCDSLGNWSEIWLDTEHAPFAARVGAVRKGSTQPLWGVARFISYAPKSRDGEIYGNWKSMPDVMLAKCAEALALRKAFPQDVSGLYTGDEMQQAIPDDQRELLDGVDLGNDEKAKAVIASDNQADGIISEMRTKKDHTALYAYKEGFIATVWKKLEQPDRDRIQAEYKSMMEKFAERAKQ